MTTTATPRKRGRPPKVKPHAVVDFINDLKHTGDFIGEPFALRPWQENIVRRIFDENGKARYRRVFIGLPRKNGKTELVAAIVCFLLLASGRRGHRIYSASGDAKQAAIIHEAASTMIGQSEAMSAVCQIYRGNDKQIKFEANGSRFEALSSDAALKHGLKPTVNIFDEVHVFPNGSLHAALETGMGATKEPLTIYITTAGWDRTSLCWELWSRARAAKADPASDPTFLPILYELEDGEDWSDESVWHRINPGLGDFCHLEDMRDKFQTAVKFPVHENEFRQFSLNQWTQQQNRWINVDAWSSCAFCLGDIDLASMEGQSCYSGFDRGVTGDISAYWMIWPVDGGLKIAGRCWLPRDGKWRDELRNKELYPLWQKMGAIRFTDGNVADAVDGGQIEREIIELNERFPVRSMFADKAYASDLLNSVAAKAMVPIAAIAQIPSRLNEACVALEEMILSQKIEHGDNPVLNAAIANATIKRNPTGLMCLDKSSMTERIDPLAALINAIAAWKADPERDVDLVYNQPGQLVL